MKKSLLSLAMFIGSMTAVQAQCTIQNSCTPTNGYCSTPASGTSLPAATEATAYSTVIQVSLASTYSGATINNATVTAVTGLPTGLSYSTNPTNGVINGGSDGCILIAGTPAVGSAGPYVVTANATVNSSFGPIPVSMTWSLTVNGSTGVAAAPAKPNVVVSPNPASSQLTVTADFHFEKAKVYDALGNLVIVQDANNSYKTALDLSKVNPGIYFVQVSDGTRSATIKFIKQ